MKTIHSTHFPTDSYRLQFITHYNNVYSYIDSARIALEGGCRWIQLRMKDTEEALLEETAVIVQKMCKNFGATFIIDDHVHLTRKLKADGVHLGKNDMPVAEARKILGDSYIIGSTVNSFQDILSVIETSTPDYFGCGPFRFTSTKKKLSPILGLEGYREIISQMKENGIDIPLVAIGGISKEDIPELLQSGIKGMALSGSILKAENPQDEMKEIVNIISMNR